MTEQSKIIAELHILIMAILKNGSASVEQGHELDKLEDILLQQNCFKEMKDSEYTYQGEEIAALFLSNSYNQAIDKMCEYNILPEDFFGLTQYHFDEDDDEEEELVKMFTNNFISEVVKAHKIHSK